jgi:hypothetical protein
MSGARCALSSPFHHETGVIMFFRRIPPQGPIPPGPRGAQYYSIRDAAPRLGLTEQALRARCTRGAVREGREVRAHLGDGVIAVKFGRVWRIRFPS